MKSEYMVRQLEYPGSVVEPRIEWPIDSLLVRAGELVVRSWELHEMPNGPADNWPAQFHSNVAKALIEKAERRLREGRYH